MLTLLTQRAFRKRSSLADYQVFRQRIFYIFLKFSPSLSRLPLQVYATDIFVYVTCMHFYKNDVTYCHLKLKSQFLKHSISELFSIVEAPSIKKISYTRTAKNLAMLSSEFYLEEYAQHELIRVLLKACLAITNI